MAKQINTGFYDIFKGKLDRMKEDLKKELERAKSDRRKDWIKHQIKQIKSLRDTVKEMEIVMNVKTHCPHCGEKL